MDAKFKRWAEAHVTEESNADVSTRIVISGIGFGFGEVEEIASPESMGFYCNVCEVYITDSGSVLSREHQTRSMETLRAHFDEHHAGGGF